MSIVIYNKKATFEYFIEDRYEAGICLLGSEVKSIRRGGANLVDSHVIIKDTEAWIYNFHISPYKNASSGKQHDPIRIKKILLHKHQINKIYGKIQQKGMTAIVTKIYFSKSGLAKAEVCVAKGKQLHDKRKSLKENDLKMQAKREMNYDDE